MRRRHRRKTLRVRTFCQKIKLKQYVNIQIGGEIILRTQALPAKIPHLIVAWLIPPYPMVANRCKSATR